MTKRGLGRGLEALIPNIARQSENLENIISDLPLDSIVSNKSQPRKKFDDETLEELAESIKEFGVIQPIIVRSLSDSGSQQRYEIITGERRYRAAKKLGMNTIPSIINKDINDTSSLEMALIENIQREDLSPIELSHTFKQLIEEFKLTHEELSKRIGKSRAAITNFLRLLKLPVEVQKLIDEGKVSTGHAKVIAGLERKEDQIEVSNLVVKKDLSVREVERVVNKKNSPPSKKKPVDIIQFNKLPILSQKISDYLEAPVKIKVTKRTGKIVIGFNSIKDLTRIVAKIVE